MPMTFNDAMTTLQIANPPAEWAENWERAQASFPDDGLPCVTETFLDEMNRVCAYPDDIMAVLRATCAAVRRDDTLSRLAWLWEVLVFHATEEPSVRDWPLPSAMGTLAEMFPAVVILSTYPRLFAMHRERGIPEEVTRDTCRDLEIWMRHALRTTGAWGFTRLFWMMNHCTGRLYRVGRLQFIHRPFYGSARAFRHRGTRRVIALSEPGIVYRRDGLVDGTNGLNDEQAWTATLEMDDKIVRGYPIHPRGIVDTTMTTLDRAEWEQVLAPGDPVLDMHIPADGRMDHEDCGASVRQALEFYARYFPELPTAHGFCCFSWLLDSQYENMLPPESNIVRFLREFYCYPVRSDDLDPFFRVFAGKPADLSTAPRDTALRRAMLDATLAGHPVRMAGGFILREGLAWGDN